MTSPYYTVGKCDECGAVKTTNVIIDLLARYPELFKDILGNFKENAIPWRYLCPACFRSIRGLFYPTMAPIPK